MKILILLLLFTIPVFANLSNQERNYLRKMSMTYCSCRNGTHTIYFDKEKPLAKVFCKNGESKVFWTIDSYKVCKNN